MAAAGNAAVEPLPPKHGGSGGQTPTEGTALSPLATVAAATVTPRRPKKNMVQLLEADRERLVERESAHWRSYGKQVSSTRSTNPAWPMDSKTRVRQDARAREITEHPMVSNPPPMDRPADSWGPCIVLKGWGQEKRWYDDPPENGAHPVPLQIRHSTHASPFSQTYPYEELAKRPGLEQLQQSQQLELESLVTSPASPSAQAQQQQQQAEPLSPARPQMAAPPGHPKPNAMTPRPPQKPPQQQPDYNVLHLKYKNRASWSFGSSGLGSRFRPGTQFSRKQQVATTSRLVGFRELRDQLPPGFPPPVQPPGANSTNGAAG